MVLEEGWIDQDHRGEQNLRRDLDQTAGVLSLVLFIVGVVVDVAGIAYLLVLIVRNRLTGPRIALVIVVVAVGGGLLTISKVGQ